MSTMIDNAKVQWSAFICSWFGTPKPDGAGNLTFMTLRHVGVIGTSAVLINKIKCSTGIVDDSYVFKNIR